MQRSVTTALLILVALAVLAALVNQTSCIMAGQGNDSADAGDAASSSCDHRDSCNSCLQCAQAGPCADLLSDCWNNSACVAIYQCYELCGVDQECKQQCLLSNPLGVDDHNAAEDCQYCQQCPSDCAGYRSCS